MKYQVENEHKKFSRTTAGPWLWFACPGLFQHLPFALTAPPGKWRLKAEVCWKTGPWAYQGTSFHFFWMHFEREKKNPRCYLCPVMSAAATTTQLCAPASRHSLPPSRHPPPPPRGCQPIAALPQVSAAGWWTASWSHQPKDWKTQSPWSFLARRETEVTHFSGTKDDKTSNLPKIKTCFRWEHAFFPSKLTAPLCPLLTSEQPCGCTPRFPSWLAHNHPKLADDSVQAARCSSQSKGAELPSPGSSAISRAVSYRQMHP